MPRLKHKRLETHRKHLRGSPIHPLKKLQWVDVSEGGQCIGGRDEIAAPHEIETKIKHNYMLFGSEKKEHG